MKIKAMKNFTLSLLLLFVAFQVFAQKLEYNMLFEGIGDNREFSSRKATSQTILGTRGLLRWELLSIITAYVQD